MWIRIFNFNICPDLVVVLHRKADVIASTTHSFPLNEGDLRTLAPLRASRAQMYPIPESVNLEEFQISNNLVRRFQCTFGLPTLAISDLLASIQLAASGNVPPLRFSA